jgi:hypothetical protein
VAVAGHLGKGAGGGVVRVIGPEAVPRHLPGAPVLTRRVRVRKVEVRSVQASSGEGGGGAGIGVGNQGDHGAMGGGLVCQGRSGKPLGAG